jgi:hypothetical protein
MSYSTKHVMIFDLALSVTSAEEKRVYRCSGCHKWSELADLPGLCPSLDRRRKDRREKERRHANGYVREPASCADSV